MSDAQGAKPVAPLNRAVFEVFHVDSKRNDEGLSNVVADAPLTPVFDAVVAVMPSGRHEKTPNRLKPVGGSNVTQLAVQLSQRWNLSLWEEIAAITPDGVVRPVVERRQQQIRLDAVSRLALVTDYESGATLGQVAKKYGVHISTAARCVTNAGVTVRQQEVKIRPEDLPVIQGLHRDGTSLEAIGRAYGCSGVAIAKRLRGYEADLPRTGIEIHHRNTNHETIDIHASIARHK